MKHRSVLRYDFSEETPSAFASVTDALKVGLPRSREGRITSARGATLFAAADGPHGLSWLPSALGGLLLEEETRGRAWVAAAMLEGNRGAA